MFNKQNFCHIASNNRNDVKAGVFVYKTTDDLDAVSVSGYFNEKIIDINLHDLIIHEWHNPNDRTDVQYNLLCVVERTLDNVGTVVIETGWQQGIDAAIEQLEIDLSGKVSKIGDTMTGPLLWKTDQWSGGIAGMPYGVVFLDASTETPTAIATIEGSFGFVPRQNLTYNLGASNYRWKELYVKDIWANTIINGNKITIPTVSSPDTFALKSELNAIANAGAMLTSKGVWYAKMDPNSTVPASAEVEGRNYADFTQVDGNNDPIIVIYEYTSGAWTVTDTITPPALTDGYVLITSKIWDIPEQTGQQGGRVYWNHTDQTFTPFPTIISFDGANITNSTLTGCTASMSPTPTTDDVANVGYVQSLIAAAAGFEIFDVKWRDSTTGSIAWALADGNWKTQSAAVQHLADDMANDPVLSTETVAGVTVTYYRANDGHKICLPAEETNVDAIYVATGVAWYYIYDADNQRFKLPRTQFAFTAKRTSAGDYVEPGLPNITGQFGNTSEYRNCGSLSNATGAFASLGSRNGRDTDGSHSSRSYGLSFDASRSSAIYGNSTTVQPPATQMYLYFYVGI